MSSRPFPRAVGEFAGESQAPGRGFARNVLAFLAPDPFFGSLDHECQEIVCLGGITGEPVIKTVSERLLDEPRRFGTGQFLLRLPLELRLGG